MWDSLEVHYTWSQATFCWLLHVHLVLLAKYKCFQEQGMHLTLLLPSTMATHYSETDFSEFLPQKCSPFQCLTIPQSTLVQA